MVAPLVVIEAPGKCRAIAAALSLPVASVVATNGHFWSQPLRPIGIDRWWREPLRAADVRIANLLKQAAKHATEVIVATDDDQEGEVIARDVHATLSDVSNRVFSRMRLRGMDPESVLAAFVERRRYMPEMYVAGDVRRMIDRMVGGLLHDESRPGAVGRVRTAMLGHVRNLPARTVYGSVTIPVNGDRGRVFQASGLFREAEWREIAETAAKVRSLKPGGEAALQSNPPNTMDVLLASPVLDMRPTQVMSLMQRLYEQGLMSYPRSRSRCLDKGAAQWAMDAAAVSRRPVSRERVVHALSAGSDSGHPCLYPKVASQSLGLSAPLLGGNLDQAILRFIARRNVLAVSDVVRLVPDQNEMPDALRALDFADTSQEFGMRSVHSATHIVQRSLSPEMMALTVLNDAGIGRPSTYAAHALRFSELGVLGNDGRLNERGIELAAVSRPNLLEAGFCRAVDQLPALPNGTDAGTVEVLIQSTLGMLSEAEQELLAQRLSASSAEAGIDAPMALAAGG